jgi:hypothetical protein
MMSTIEFGRIVVLSKIGSRLTFANITATLALVFAMSGGALAATHYLLNSTKQINPKVLRALKGQSGVAGPKGSQGVAGTPGTQGPEGKGGAGANGVGVTSREFEGAAGDCMEGGSEFTAANGTTFACNGKEGREGREPKKGPEGPSWPSSLPSEATEMGTWGFVSNAEGLTRVPLSFSVPTKEPLEPTLGKGPVELLEPLATDPNCPGTVAKPKADPGFICVYSEQLEDPLSGEGPVRASGVVLIFKSNSTAPKIDEGSWAMTAP